MAGGAALLADRRVVVSACVSAVRDLHTVLFQSPSGELADLAGDLAELRAVCAAQLAAVVAEAETRGVVDASQAASTAGWVAEVAWHSRREAATLARTARVLRRPDLAAVAAAVREVDLDPGTAVVVAAEYDKLAPDLKVQARPVVLERFLTVGAECGPAGVRQLRQEILARYAENGQFEDHQDRCRRLVDLTAGKQTSTGVWAYEFTTDNEGRAVLEAAIGPLSAPRPDPVTGEKDPRPVGRRRGEALIEALRRSVTAARPASPKTVLLLTMTYNDLANQTNAATTLGTRAAGTLLAPDTVRKLACDAGIIPVVLGGDGEILDQGREQRLFTPAQVRALTLRDQHCTFPHCTMPATWCAAHHLTHWIDGGPTDLNNAALLCPGHHTIAHRDQLAGVVTPHGIQWDRRPGSYQPPGRHQPGAPPKPPHPPPEPGSRPRPTPERAA